MPVNIDGPQEKVLVEPSLLKQASFSEFGTVIENGYPSLIPSPRLAKGSLPRNAVQANQGSALKYLDVTDMKDLYNSAPSQVSSKAVLNMFVCGPRSLIASEKAHVDGTFPVRILERHPYTTQTFVPLGISPSEASKARYVVIVAPSFGQSSADEALPVPPCLPGRGLPDLKRIRAFVANGSQAVTYGAGIWHAPMVVVGDKPIDFVVVQFANGVGLEDCQEAELRVNQGDKLLVEVPTFVMISRRKAKL